jgi:hypothetical protein
MVKFNSIYFVRQTTRIKILREATRKLELNNNQAFKIQSTLFRTWQLKEPATFSLK